MWQKVSSYIMEIVVGIVIFVWILFFLPKNTVEIPDLSSLQVPEGDINFIFSSVDTPQSTGSQSIGETWDLQQNTGMVVNTWVVDSWTIDEAVIETWTAVTKPGIAETWTQTTTEPISYKSCESPWWDSLVHGESIFAYSQRMDEPDICNIQRRTCNDWVLDGSYTQQSCLSYASSPTQYQEVISYNNPHADPYIQPDNNWVSVNWSFDTQWQPNENRYGEPTSYRDASAGAVPYENAPVSQIQTNYGACMTPWGQTIKHGQFVKAYQLDKWFTNLPCEVHLRTCIDGELAWNFEFESCNYYNIAVEDFLNDYYDSTQPSLTHLIEVLQGIMAEDWFETSYPNIPYNSLNNYINGL